MTSRERVLATLAFREPDRVPYFEQVICNRVSSEILGRPAMTGGGEMQYLALCAGADSAAALEEVQLHFRDDWLAVVETLGFDATVPRAAGGSTDVERLDEYTFRVNNAATGTFEVVRYDPASDATYKLDTSYAQGGMLALERVIAHRQAELDSSGVGRGNLDAVQYHLDYFAGSRAVGGWGNLEIPFREPIWMEAIASRPDLIEAHLDMQCQIACAHIATQVAMGVDFIWGGGHLAGTGGPLYSPAAFRRFMLPRLKQITDACAQHGLRYFFRTNGNVWPLAADLFGDSGVTGYAEIDAMAGMRLAGIRREFPHLAMWGNVDCTGALVSGTPEDVAAEVRACIDDAAAGGGYMLGSSCAIHSTVKTENFLTMLETCREYGVY